MEIDGFWKIIERALVGHERDEPDDVAHAGTLRGVLESLSDDDLIDFHNLFFQLESRAERMDVWGAGMCSTAG
jgi:hypothetical protein